jgi:two-component system, NarL family, nitrate/nitrite response regulator NarL
MIRVAVVDDHPIARRGIEQMLAGADDVEVVESVATASELSADAADVVIMDLYHDGDVPCLAAVGATAAVARVLVISASGQASDVVGAIRAGASGYVTKHAEAQMFVAAVRTVAAGGFAMSSQLADILQAGLSVQAPAAVAGPLLSAREEETLGLIAKGLTHAQVAKRMGVSKATVDTYVERIRAKLQVGNKAELTRAALERFGDRVLGERS